MRLLARGKSQTLRLCTRRMVKGEKNRKHYTVRRVYKEQLEMDPAYCAHAEW